MIETILSLHTLFLFKIKEIRDLKNNHPKRKKNPLNNYELFYNEKGYYISFKDGANILQHLEISKDIYDLFNAFELEDISYLNEVSRHYDPLDINLRTLHERTLCQESSIEDDAMKNIQFISLHNAISKLPSVQKRRLLFYYFYELTFKEIAVLEDCSQPAIKYSVDAAINKLRSILQDQSE